MDSIELGRSDDPHMELAEQVVKYVFGRLLEKMQLANVLQSAQ